MLSTGEKLSHFKIISSIGSGGMGEVYLADDTKLERRVALKVLLPEVANDDERVRRFIQEAKAASALNHPNILTVFEIGHYNDLQYIATEFIKGETLRDRMNGEPLKLRETLEITLQVAAALGAAHEAGIIHRDIKPENIMIRDDGLVKVLDFGLAKLSGVPNESVDTTLPQFNTQPGVVVGTVAYMSPEQARGRKLDPRSDIFSLGIVMFELFTGRRPFAGEGHLDLISSILKDEAPALRQVAPDLPRQLERMVEKTLRKDREHRYQHIKDLYIDIEDLKEELKFEAKLNQSVQPTLAGTALYTNPSDLRSAFKTGISKTRRFTLLHAFIFLTCAAIMFGSIWYFGLITGPSAPIPGSYKTTEVATWNSGSGELGTSARFSPDGKLIAFASTKSGTKNIWVTLTGSTEPRQVTNDDYQNIDPIWSPKGDEIAYFSDRTYSQDGGQMTGIWRVSALGGTPKFVGQPSSRGFNLKRWASSGKIYYVLGSDLYAMNAVNGDSEKIITVQTEGRLNIDISSDEKLILYVVQKGDEWRIVQRPIDNEKVTDILKGNGKIDSIAWIPEKNRLFYSTLVDGISQIFVSTIGSGRSSRITAAETDNAVVDVSGDGRSILSTSAKEESQIWRTNSTDGQETPVARDINAKLWPSVSPDGSKIVFQSVRNLSQGNKLSNCAIVTKSSKQDESEKPAVIADHASIASWSPNGLLLAFLRDVGNKTELFVVNSTGNGERQLTQGGVALAGYSTSPYNYLEVQNFSWSHDASRILYVSNKNGFSNVWEINVFDSSELMLTTNQEKGLIFSSTLWSNDGNQVAISYRKASQTSNEKPLSGVKTIDTVKREVSNLYESTNVVRGMGWASDTNHFVIAEMEKFGNAGPTNIVFKKCPISGTGEILIADLKNVYFYNTFLSGDKKFIAFAARNDNKDDLWIIPVVGGTARKTTNNNDSGVYYSRLAWFHDGSAITYGKQTRFSLLSMISEIE